MDGIRCESVPIWTAILKRGMTHLVPVTAMIETTDDASMECFFCCLLSRCHLLDDTTAVKPLGDIWIWSAIKTTPWSSVAIVRTRISTLQCINNLFILICETSEYAMSVNRDARARIR